ncbi:MAG TPA: DUF748 domain-containing protein, partial [Atribacterota bacterium]|nr:DUF748 domain-containing protein [Atribacterota bacterium]
NENIKIERVSFKNSSLVYHDEIVYHYELDALTTKAKNVSGYFDFSTWPETTFALQGRDDRDDALLSFSGFFFTQKREYSLDFHLRNADLTHFKYYLEAAEQLNISRGKFDLDLNLSISPESVNNELDWQGKAVFYEGDAQPFFLNEIPFRKINGEVNFIKPEITLSGLNGLYEERPFQLEGLLLTQPELYFDLNITTGPVNAALLKDDLSLFMGEYKDFSIQGEVDLSVNVQGFPGAFDIQGTVTTPEIMVENLTLPNITANFLLKQEELIINSLESESSEGSVSVTGKLDWTGDSPFYHFEIETSRLSFQNPLFRQLSNLDEFSGSIDSSFLMENKKRDNENNILNLTGKFTINNPGGSGFSLPDPLKGDIKATLDLSDNVLSIEQCKLSSGKIDGFLKGNLQWAEAALIMLDWEAQVSDLAQFSSIFGLETPLAGRAQLQGKVKGSWPQPEIDI